MAKMLLQFFCLVSVFAGFCAGNSLESVFKGTSKHGQSCNETVRCDRDLGLFCDEGKCWCALPGGRYTAGSSDPCLRLAGYPCTFQGKKPDSNMTESQEAPSLIECMERAVCSDNGFCKCEPRFYQNWNNQCIPKKEFGESCESEEECDSNKMLACVNGKCDCFFPKEMYLDEDGCRIMVGRNCVDLIAGRLNTSRILSADSAQVDDPFTREERETQVWVKIQETFSFAQCIFGSKCNATTGRCGFLQINTSTGIQDACPKDQYKNVVGGTCEILMETGENCTVAEECNAKKLLSCVDGKCDCDPDVAIEKKYEVYSKEVSHCVGKVGTTCNGWGGRSNTPHPAPIPGHKYCLDQGVCYKRNNAVYGDELGVCQCNIYSQMTRDKTCAKSYDEYCDLDQPCVDYLICTDGKCLCPNRDYQIHEWVYSSDGCFGNCRYLGLVGRACTQPNATTTSCVKNAECVPKQDEGFICQCKTGFITNSVGHCDIAYGHPCDHHNVEERCDKMADLSCRMVKQTQEAGSKVKSKFIGMCNCQNMDDIFDKENRKCVMAPSPKPLANLGPQKGWCHRVDKN